MIAVATSLVLAGTALAQTPSDRPSLDGVSQQFKSGAAHVGHGAMQMGEGVKQAAILTWEAMKQGASAAAARFNAATGDAQPAQKSN